ncbi:MAG: hypothetical protein IRZ14_21030, partial [Chloroflexi bacterium]|nr:hypothetical protein [Chloroflexota bacterium]
MPAVIWRLAGDPATDQMLAELAAQFGLSRSAVVRLAVQRLYVARHDLTPEDIAAQRRRPGGRPGPRPSRAYQRLQ